MRRPLGFLERCRDRYGPIFRLRLVGRYRDYVYVTDPSLAREVYATDRTIGLAGEPRRDFLEPLVGSHSLLCLEGDEWLRQRKLLGPAFHRRRIDGYEDEIAAIAGRHAGSWSTEQPFAMRPRMQEITLEVILRLVFGVTDARSFDALRAALPAVIEAGASPLVWAVPDRAWPALGRSRAARRAPHPLRRFLRLRDRVDALVYEQIERRRSDAAAGQSGNDVLSLLLDARDDEGRAMTDAELRDELLTLLEAGHETTATALAWAAERLSRWPAVLDQLREDLDAGGDEYLDAVAREVLRSRSVVFDTPRRLSGPLEIGGYLIPAGWHVAPALQLVQNSPAAFDEPDEFRPERFLDESGVRDGWIPFGGGKRHCVGSHLALMELKVILREVVRRFDLEPVHSDPEPPRPAHVTLVPAHGGVVRARRLPVPTPLSAERAWR